jgi:hypothetical protein
MNEDVKETEAKNVKWYQDNFVGREIKTPHKKII